jgi:hypothetical protein
MTEGEGLAMTAFCLHCLMLLAMTKRQCGMGKAKASHYMFSCTDTAAIGHLWAGDAHTSNPCGNKKGSLPRGIIP